VGADSRTHLEVAVPASMDGREVPLPHEVTAELAGAALAGLI
jgi:hypothetical protein